MPDAEVVRIVVPSSDGCRVLTRPDGPAGRALPRVALRWSAAVEGDAVESASRAVGAPVAPVRRLLADAWEVEALGRVPADGTEWIGRDELARLGADADAAAAWFGAAPGAGHLAPGWRRSVEAWLTELAGGAPTAVGVVRHWELAGVLRAVLPGGPVVAVKENGPVFAREAAVVAAMEGLPGVPEAVAVEGARLATRWVEGPLGAPERSIEALAALGRVQRASLERRRELAPAVAAVPPLGPAGTAALETLACLGLPDAVVHCDANPGNFVFGPDGPVIIDWTDTCWGNPLADLRIAWLGVGDSPAALDAWTAAWDDVVDPAAVRARAGEVAVLGSALQAAQYRRRAAAVSPASAPTWRLWQQEWEDQLAADVAAWRST